MAATAAAVLPGALPTPAYATGAPPISLVIERRTIDVAGRASSVFGLRQPDGTPGLELMLGQRCGVAETGGAVDLPNAMQAYDFAARPGTHWMYAHHDLQTSR